MESLTEFFVIRSKSGEFYKPTYGEKFWKPTMKKAKVYTNIGHAKCAITTKMEHYIHLKTSNWVKPSKEELDAYSKFEGCQIIKMGFMHSADESVRYTQGID